MNVAEATRIDFSCVFLIAEIMIKEFFWMKDLGGKNFASFQRAMLFFNPKSESRNIMTAEQKTAAEYKFGFGRFF